VAAAVDFTDILRFLLVEYWHLVEAEKMWEAINYIRGRGVVCTPPDAPSQEWRPALSAKTMTTSIQFGVSKSDGLPQRRCTEYETVKNDRIARLQDEQYVS
jgi:hypothetical protein